ncbi:hypothetical protein CBR_g21230 [Chara braunii]|uniref:Uncharacterized protein n=1 Tax=Chara braunii TaxID=69332 RepID=A0A388L115_CHABU|nr:hypothetical protein CBR_g21230 [Chara braunii]|eukprot:GBG75989.1 hypothetical protein CBR_g21230 [Chara braunii]
MAAARTAKKVLRMTKEKKMKRSMTMATAMAVALMTVWTIPSGPSCVVAARLLNPYTKTVTVLKPLDICDFYFDGYEFTVPTFAIQQAGDITYGPIFKTK